MRTKFHRLGSLSKPETYCSQFWCLDIWAEGASLVGESLLPGSKPAPSHMVEGTKKLPLFYNITDPIHESSTLRLITTKDLTYWYHSRGLGFQCMNFTGNTNIQTITEFNSLHLKSSPWWLSDKESAETQVWSVGLEDPLEKEMATHIQYSCLEDSMDGGTGQATVYGVTKTVWHDLVTKQLCLTGTWLCAHDLRFLQASVSASIKWNQ